MSWSSGSSSTRFAGVPRPLANVSSPPSSSSSSSTPSKLGHSRSLSNPENAPPADGDAAGCASVSNVAETKTKPAHSRSTSDVRSNRRHLARGLRPLVLPKEPAMPALSGRGARVEGVSRGNGGSKAAQQKKLVAPLHAPLPEFDEVDILADDEGQENGKAASPPAYRPRYVDPTPSALFLREKKDSDGRSTPSYSRSRSSWGSAQYAGAPHTTGLKTLTLASAFAPSFFATSVAGKGTRTGPASKAVGAFLGDERSEDGDSFVDSEFERSGKPLAFWFIFFSLCCAVFLTSLGSTAVPTAVPTIARALHGGQVEWIGTAYLLTSTAFLPWIGGLANVFGRRAVMIFALVGFISGSALAGSATSMNMLIAARAVQGMGAGGILCTSEIIVADLVPLRKRGTFLGAMGAVWASGLALGPLFGGVFAEKLSWRWLFYMNLPVCVIDMVVILIFMRLKTPSYATRDMWTKIDMVGNFIVIASTAALAVGLAFGGILYPWGSWQILLPLISAFVGLFLFFIWEKRYGENALVPFDLLRTHTARAGYVGTLLHGVLAITVIYYIPIYFQAVVGASAVMSGVYTLPLTLAIAPASIVVGFWMVKSGGRYKLQNLLGWIVVLVATALLNLYTTRLPEFAWLLLQVPFGLGIGMLYSTVSLPVATSTPSARSANALALFTFCRNIGVTLGVALGNVVLQNCLRTELPAEYVHQLLSGASHADPGALSRLDLASVATIQLQPEPLRSEIRAAFAGSLVWVWRALLPVCALGLLLALTLRQVPLRDQRDNGEWGLDASASDSSSVDEEKRRLVLPGYFGSPDLEVGNARQVKYGSVGL